MDEPWPGLSLLDERWAKQEEGDLGERMFHCFKSLVDQGFERCLIVGTDSPTLPLNRLEAAFAALDGPGAAVLGPTLDGGYYAVGCCDPRPDMFDQVTWSADSTLTDTMRAFERVGYRTTLLEPWWDVDEPPDLARLRRDPGIGPRTRRALGL